MSVPSGKHNDWPWPFNNLSRAANAIDDPVAPTLIIMSKNFDTEHKNPDVPNPGAWALSLHPKYGFSFAWTTKNGRYVAIGTFRFDYVDHYYTMPRISFHK